MEPTFPSLPFGETSLYKRFGFGFQNHFIGPSHKKAILSMEFPYICE
jgi:hypothetical protein